MTNVISKFMVLVTRDLLPVLLNNTTVAELNAVFGCQGSHHFRFANIHYAAYKKTEGY
jgi:hypothetical protein